MATEAATALKLRVEGMDCGACAIKIENGLKRLPGVTDINVNVGLAMLSLVVDEDRTSRATIEQRIRSLGYTPHPADGEAARGAEAWRPEPAERDWWRTRKAQLVLGAGALLGVAFAIGILAPALAPWAYTAAALLGVLPVLRRAIAGARHGTPFSIETLMSVAAVGAVAIGQSAEAAVVVFLFAVGEFLENFAAGRARAELLFEDPLVHRPAPRQARGVHLAREQSAGRLGGEQQSQPRRPCGGCQRRTLPGELREHIVRAARDSSLPRVRELEQRRGDIRVIASGRPVPGQSRAQTRIAYPDWLVTIVQVNPLTYAVDALRGTLINYNQFAPWLGVVVIAVAAVVLFAIALYDFHRE